MGYDILRAGQTLKTHINHLLLSLNNSIQFFIQIAKYILAHPQTESALFTITFASFETIYSIKKKILYHFVWSLKSH